MHGQWRTEPVSPAVGLRQCCSLSPLMFRWCVEDLEAAVWRFWMEDGQFLELDEIILHLSACADDVFALATTVDAIQRMGRAPRSGAWRTVGLSLWADQCKWAKVRRYCGPGPQAQKATPLLDSMQRLQEGECLRAQRVRVQVDGRHGEDFRLLVQSA